MAFYVGQKVVTVNSYYHQNYPYDKATMGGIYTVSSVYTADDGDTMITLYELNQPNDDVWYAGERAKHWRPVVERKTDISELVKIAQEAARTGKVLA